MKQTKAVEEETINNIILELRNIREFEPYCKGMVDRNHTTRIFKKHLDIAIKSARADERDKMVKEDKKEMRCKICNELDDTYTAYCIKCGRSPHILVKS